MISTKGWGGGFACRESWATPWIVVVRSRSACRITGAAHSLPEGFPMQAGGAQGAAAQAGQALVRLGAGHLEHGLRGHFLHPWAGRGLGMKPPAGIGGKMPLPALGTPAVVAGQPHLADGGSDVAATVFGLAVQRSLAPGADPGGGGGLKLGRRPQQSGSQAPHDSGVRDPRGTQGG
jgi:hypothetical protein